MALMKASFVCVCGQVVCCGGKEVSWSRFDRSFYDWESQAVTGTCLVYLGSANLCFNSCWQSKHHNITCLSDSLLVLSVGFVTCSTCLSQNIRKEPFKAPESSRAGHLLCVAVSHQEPSPSGKDQPRVNNTHGIMWGSE